MTIVRRPCVQHPAGTAATGEHHPAPWTERAEHDFHLLS
jgi:hypothetical protein